MTLKLRPAAPSDLPALADILYRAKVAAGFPAELMATFHDRVRITPATLETEDLTIATADDEPVGFVGGMARDDRYILTFLFVAPEVQHKGLGQLLLKTARNQAQGRGLSGLMLESDPRAEEFYLKAGFKRLSSRPNTLIKGEEITLLDLPFPPIVQPIGSLDITFEPDAVWPFETKNAEAIAAHWQEALTENPHMWNGKILQMADMKISAGHLTARCFPVSFAATIAWRDWGCPDSGVFNGFGTALVRSRDGALLYGVQASTTANSGKTYPFGGNLDLSDVRNGNSVDVLGSITRELEEETGLSPRLTSSPLLAVFDGPHFAVAREFCYDLTAEELRRRILHHAFHSEEKELADVCILHRPDDLPATKVPGFARLLAQQILGNAESVG